MHGYPGRSLGRVPCFRCHRAGRIVLPNNRATQHRLGVATNAPSAANFRRRPAVTGDDKALDRAFHATKIFQGFCLERGFRHRIAVHDLAMVTGLWSYSRLRTGVLAIGAKSARADASRSCTLSCTLQKLLNRRVFVQRVATSACTCNPLVAGSSAARPAILRSVSHTRQSGELPRYRIAFGAMAMPPPLRG